MSYGPASNFRLPGLDTSGPSRGSPRYPDPFFDVAQMRLPSGGIKALFGACTYAMTVDPLVKAAADKMAAYPITPIQFSAWPGTTLSEDDKQRWKTVLLDRLDLPTHQISIGLDYYGFGNSLLSVRYPFKKYLTCRGCKESFDIGNLRPKKHYTVSKYIFELVCPKCSHRGSPDVYDDYPRSVRGIRLKRWSLNDIDIEYYPMSGDCEYYYTPSAAMKAQINSGDPKALAECPVELMDALAKGQTFRLNPANVFHFRPPGIVVDDPNMGWGFPPILPTLKDGYYTQLMKKAQEALLHEHIVPHRWFSPESTSTVDVFRSVNLRQWKSMVISEIEKRKTDQNHITVFPLPMRLQQFGGSGKSLLLVPEIQEMSKQRLAGMGVPVELVFGGLRWTASSVSLRMLENLFMTYRDQQHRMINHFLIPALSRVLGLPRVKVMMSNFRMGDDVQSKQLLLQLAQTSKISDSRLLAEFDFDYREEQEKIDQENRVRAWVLMRQKLEELHIEGEAATLQAMYQRRIQEAQMAGVSQEGGQPDQAAGPPGPGGSLIQLPGGRLRQAAQQSAPPGAEAPQPDMRPPPQGGPPRRGGGTALA